MLAFWGEAVMVRYLFQAMPTYDYVCQSCGKDYEVFQRMSEDPHTECNCEQKQPVKRKIGTGAGIIFKGGGFYETDFKEKSGKPAAKEGEKKAESSESKPSSGENGTKSEAAKPAPAAEKKPAKTPANASA